MCIRDRDGTLYTKAELEAISGVCRAWKIPLYVDGARLGYGLASEETDVTLEDMARYADVFLSLIHIYLVMTSLARYSLENSTLSSFRNRVMVVPPLSLVPSVMENSVPPSHSQCTGVAPG